jgi:RNA polymerase sigma-70 factor (ECF subfamily)
MVEKQVSLRELRRITMKTHSAAVRYGSPLISDSSQAFCPRTSAEPPVGPWPGNSSFQALCKKLRPDLLRFAHWLTHNKALAEDVVQEALLRAWKSRNSLLHESAAKAWLRTIIRNEYARTFERKRLVMVDVDWLIATEEPALAADDEQDLDDIREALRGLPEHYRRPLEMQVRMGYSIVEIASQLNLSSAAVLTRLFRARNQLRAACGSDRLLSR